MTNMQIDDIVERLTEGEAWMCQRLKPQHLSIYRTVRYRLDEYLLDFIASNIRFFTSHGKRHALGVIRQMYSLLRGLPPETLNQMTSVEVLILLCSAWLHDIGLLVNKDSAGFPLSDKEIRDQHHRLSRDKILEIHSDAGIDNPNLAHLLAQVCMCHRRSAVIPEHLPEEQAIQGERARPRLMAGILRMADAMDTDWDRAPQVLLEKMTDLPDLARLHWRACQMLEIVCRPAQGEIHLDATIDSSSDLSADDARRLFLWKFDDLCKEFSDISHLFQSHGLPYERLTGTLDYPPKVQVSSDEPLPEEVWPLEVILYDRYRREHETRGEYIFAADWCYQAGRLYESDLVWHSLDRARQYYVQAAEYVRHHRRSSKNDRYWSNLLEHYFNGKARSGNNELPDESGEFLRDMDSIERQLDLTEQLLGSFFGYKKPEVLHLLLKMGHSPKREVLGSHLDLVAEELRRKGTLDGECPYCTGWAVSAMWLAGWGASLGNTLQWLQAQGPDMEWRHRQGLKRGYVHTASVLLGLVDASEIPYQDDSACRAFRLLLDPSTDWDKDRDDPKIESDRLIIYACGAFWKRLGEDARLNYKDTLTSKVWSFLRLTEDEFVQPTRNVVDIYSLIESLRAIAPGLLLSDDLRKKVQQRKIEVIDHFLWDTARRDQGTIGSDASRLISTDPGRSLEWLWGWASYWHYELLWRELAARAENLSNEEASSNP